MNLQLNYFSDCWEAAAACEMDSVQDLHTEQTYITMEKHLEWCNAGDKTITELITKSNYQYPSVIAALYVWHGSSVTQQYVTITTQADGGLNYS